MPLAKRMQKYMNIKELSVDEIADKSGISRSDLQKFLTGHGAIDSAHFETLNSLWPEMIAYTFNIDACLCNELHLTKQ